MERDRQTDRQQTYRQADRQADIGRAGPAAVKRDKVREKEKNKGHKERRKGEKSEIDGKRKHVEDRVEERYTSSFAMKYNIV